MVGKPTHFLSHAWSYRVLNLLDAIEGFVESLPEGSPEPVFWFDCFSLDQHSHNDKGSDWWRTTFKAAIGSMGHTVMVHHSTYHRWLDQADIAAAAAALAG